MTGLPLDVHLHLGLCDKPPNVSAWLATMPSFGTHKLIFVSFRSGETASAANLTITLNITQARQLAQEMVNIVKSYEAREREQEQAGV
jgi:hypothetical protein